jgi:hypothetical protein
MVKVAISAIASCLGLLALFKEGNEEREIEESIDFNVVETGKVNINERRIEKRVLDLLILRESLKRKEINGTSLASAVHLAESAE